MTIYILPKKENEASIFKKELKFMDFYYVTFRYLNTTPLNREEQTPVAMRIHNFVFPMQEAILNYDLKKRKQDVDVYESINKGLKETVRRAKISLGILKENNALFIGYWSYLVNVYREDAKLLGDKALERCIDNFESYVQTMKP
jgi:hypothetical protein